MNNKLEIHISGPKTSDVQIFHNDQRMRAVQYFRTEVDAEITIPKFIFHTSSLLFAPTAKPENAPLIISFESELSQYASSKCIVKYNGEIIGFIKSLEICADTKKENNDVKFKFITDKELPDLPDWIEISFDKKYKMFLNKENKN